MHNDIHNLKIARKEKGFRKNSLRSFYEKSNASEGKTRAFENSVICNNVTM